MKKINYKKGELAYYTFGKGAPIVLIHGYCEDSFIFFHLVKNLHKNYRIILIDLPGFGESTCATEKTDMLFYAGSIEAVLKAEKIDKAILGGHSMGGYILLHLLEKNAAVFNALVLINSHCFEDSEEKKANRKKSIEFIKKNGTSLFLKEFYRNLFPQNFTDRKIINTLFERGKNIPAAVVIQAAEAMIARKDKSKVLATCGIPILQFSGGNDSAIAKEISLKMATIPPSNHLQYDAQKGHMSFYELKNFAAIFQQFCEKII